MCGRYRLKDPKKAFDWFEVVPSSDFPTTVQHSTQPHPLGPASGLRLCEAWAADANFQRVP
jgi:hypothetical protein